MIVPMLHVQLVGPRALLGDALRAVQRAGVLDVVATTGPAGLLRTPPVPAAREAELAGLLRRVETLLALAPDDEAGAGERAPRPGDPERWVDELARTITALDARRTELARERREVERHLRALAALAPLASALPPGGTMRSVAVVLRRDAGALQALEEQVARSSGGAYHLVSAPVPGTELQAALVTVPRAVAARVTALLAEHGAEELALPAGLRELSFPRAVSALAERRRVLADALGAAERERAEVASRARAPLRALARELGGERDRLAVLRHVAETGHAFVVTGWTPAARAPALEAALRDALGAAAALTTRPADRSEADAPVLLANHRLVRPFERLLALVGPPRYGSIDPTPWFAVSFPLLFGVVLADAAFGLLGGAFALAVLRSPRAGALARDLAHIALACSASALVFGIAFGEALGELGAHLGMEPLLFRRTHALTSFLALAVGLGLAHVVAGMVLGVVSAARRRNVRRVLARVARVGLLVALAVFVLAAAGRIEVEPNAVGVAALALAVVALLAEGPLALLEGISAAGHVLSYARLMAIGLASALLADTANLLGASVKPAAAGLALAAMLHGVNFTLCLASPIVAALRLQIVEFLDGFYEEGGRPFHPLKLAP